MSNSIVDMHSHLGVDSLPDLAGTRDTNSRKGPILPVSIVCFRSWTTLNAPLSGCEHLMV